MLTLLLTEHSSSLRCRVIYMLHASKYWWVFSSHKVATRRNLTMKALLCVIIILTTLSKSTIIKKLCVEYQIQNSRWSGAILDVMHNVDVFQCLRKCLEYPNCMAYNLWRGNGTRELVPALRYCDETLENYGSTFVYLRPCSGRVPWVVGQFNSSTETSCLFWERRNIIPGINACPEHTLRPPTARRCATVFPHKGLYLPGWYRDEHYVRLVTELGNPVYCKGPGYMLAKMSDCPITWQKYTAGQPIPSNAVPVGAWKDGTPLYLVLSGEYFGYYLPSEQTNFIHIGNTQNPLEVNMLVRESIP